MSDAGTVVADPHWLPFRYDHASRSILFVKADRRAHRETTFLDDQLLKLCPDRRQVGIQEVLRHLDGVAEAPLHFIFHSAFCCSTLLARALDVPGAVMALKEPLILNDITQIALSAGSVDPVRDLLTVALRLLARPFDGSDQMVVKPSNVANLLIGASMSALPRTAAAFLTSDLEEFLRSVAKKGLFGRGWARRQASMFERVPQFDPGFTQAEKWEQSDLQVAAMAWLQQRVQFARLLDGLPRERAASLNSRELLAAPAKALQATSDLFDLGLSPDTVQEIATGPVFATDSKRHEQAYDAQRRGEEHKSVGTLIDEEIAMVAQWANAVAAHSALPTTLGKQLVSPGA